MHLGLDIGYSSLKISFGQPGESARHITLPVGVTRCDNGAATTSVLATESRWPSMIWTTWQACGRTWWQTMPAPSIRNYTRTPQYRALYHAALASTGAKTIDRVVEVREAKVYPQPAGSYISYLSGSPERNGVMSSRAALVIDPGFFSVGSVVIRHNRPYPSAAATSTEAMSRLLKRAAERTGKLALAHITSSVRSLDLT